MWNLFYTFIHGNLFFFQMIYSFCVVGWDDIGYNFVIGGDGRVYEGRGWDRVGAHTKGWNSISVSFAVMGDFRDHLPNLKV